jgi:hypothetical protein
MAHTEPANRLDIPLFDEFVLGATRETSDSSTTTAEEHKNRGNVAYRKKEYEEVRSQPISRHHPSDSFRPRARPSNRALTAKRARSRTHTHRR